MLTNLKERFPFRLGTTSYIIPADIVTNVNALASYVDDVELVLFESDELSNLPDARQVRTLRRLAEAHALTYTVHLPIDTQLGDPSESERRRSVDKCLRVMAQMSPLDALAYVIHFHGNLHGKTRWEDAARWKAQLETSVGELLHAGIESRALCVENLDYPFEWIERIVVDHDLSICLDIGHILLQGYPLEAYLDRYLARSRVIHLHGLQGGCDHRDICGIDADVLARFLARLNRDTAHQRVVTLEVFDQADLERSLVRLEGLLG